MTHSQALIPSLISDESNTKAWSFLSIIGGVLLLSFLAQVWIPLPFTPVPITGQTFGVALVSLLWGSKRGFASVATYIVMGSLGAPIFAKGASGLILGPTSGYLVGMLAASYVIGSFADRGWTYSHKRAFFAAQLGSLVVFSFGMLGLSFFIPVQKLFVAGMLPFLPGDLIKTFFGSLIAYRSQKYLRR